MCTPRGRQGCIFREDFVSPPAGDGVQYVYVVVVGRTLASTEYNDPTVDQGCSMCPTRRGNIAQHLWMAPLHRFCNSRSIRGASRADVMNTRTCVEQIDVPPTTLLVATPEQPRDVVDERYAVCAYAVLGKDAVDRRTAPIHERCRGKLNILGMR